MPARIIKVFTSLQLHYQFMQIACYSNSGRLKFDMMLMIGCLLLATRLVNFWQHSGLHPIDIPVDFITVYSILNLDHGKSKKSLFKHPSSLYYLHPK